MLRIPFFAVFLIPLPLRLASLRNNFPEQAFFGSLAHARKRHAFFLLSFHCSLSSRPSSSPSATARYTFLLPSSPESKTVRMEAARQGRRSQFVKRFQLDGHLRGEFEPRRRAELLQVPGHFRLAALQSLDVLRRGGRRWRRRMKSRVRASNGGSQAKFTFTRRMNTSPRKTQLARGSASAMPPGCWWPWAGRGGRY